MCCVLDTPNPASNSALAVYRLFKDLLPIPGRYVAIIDAHAGTKNNQIRLGKVPCLS